MTLLEQALAERPLPGSSPKAAGYRWVGFRPVLEVLVAVKGYSRAAAVKWIAEREGLGKEDVRRFYEAACKWGVRPKEVVLGEMEPETEEEAR